MKIITLIFTLLFIYSCASNPYKNNAKTLFENQLYPEALIEVEKAIALNSNDMELIVLRKKIQEEVFQRELIKIRDIRIGGDVKGAITELRKLMKNAKSWNIDTNINGMSFQNNEIRNLFNYFEGEINNSLSNDLVLKALYTFDSYQDIFYSMNGNQELSNKINLKGKEKCQKMKKETLSRNLKYFKSFVNKYCHFFKEEGLSLNDIGLELYNQITVDENSIGGNVVKRAFFQSPWFNEYSSKQTNSFVKSDFFYDEKINTKHKFMSIMKKKNTLNK